MSWEGRGATIESCFSCTSPVFPKTIRLGTTKTPGVDALRRRRSRDPPSQWMVFRYGLRQLLPGSAVDYPPGFWCSQASLAALSFRIWPLMRPVVGVVGRFRFRTFHVLEPDRTRRSGHNRQPLSQNCGFRRFRRNAGMPWQHSFPSFTPDAAFAPFVPRCPDHDFSPSFAPEITSGQLAFGGKVMVSKGGSETDASSTSVAGSSHCPSRNLKASSVRATGPTNQTIMAGFALPPRPT